MLNRSRIVVLAFTAAFTAMVPALSHAQKPALTENIDEKGRVPYQAGSAANCALPHDGPQICSLSFAAVPAGYRLVITYVSASFNEGTAVSSATVSLSGGVLLPGGTTLSQGPTFVAANVGGNFILGSPVTYYVEPGGNPVLSLQNYSSFATAFISGYLVAVP
jgi:hypothetical protein